MNLTYKKVRKLFDYRPDGNLIWKMRKGNIMIDDVAGTHRKNYYSKIRIDNKFYVSHIIIWLWHHGYMPECELDHINRVKHDNRIENLREASSQCNKRNRGNFKNNKSGVKGVFTGKSWGDFWQARITVNGKQYNIGTHYLFEEAVLHRLAAEQCLDWDGCDSSSPAYQYAKSCGLIK